ncbi:hypothetical protein ACFQY9_30060 [Microvirga aerilata]|nr:hypothetical protein [Microvirga aerilata]
MIVGTFRMVQTAADLAANAATGVMLGGSEAGEAIRRAGQVQRWSFSPIMVDWSKVESWKIQTKALFACAFSLRCFDIKQHQAH